MIKQWIKSSIFFCITCVLLVSVLSIVHACTVSMQNIHNEAPSEDLADLSTKQDTAIAPEIEVPLNPL